jgi:hypothetical protein
MGGHEGFPSQLVLSHHLALILRHIRDYNPAHLLLRAMATNSGPKPIRARAKPTPEEIAKLREERELKRKALAEAAQAERSKLASYAHPLLALADDPRGQLRQREWISLSAPSGEYQRVIVKTWNVGYSFSDI